MKKLSRILAVLLVVCMMLAVIPTAFAKLDTAVIYFTNDVHGAYENYAYAAEIMKDGDIIVDAGDNIQGSVATSLTKGQCMVDMMKAVGYDLAVPGNHEFDFGFDRFTEIVKGENTPYISVNLWDKVADKAVLDGYKILEADGLKIAFVGITTPETLVKSTPTFFQNEKGEWIYDFCNDTTGEKLYKVVQDNVDAAKKAGADFVVAIGHLGTDEQSEPWTSTSVIKNTTGIDALIDGHSHSTFTEVKPNKDGKDVVVAQTGTKLENVGKLTIDQNGVIKAELIAVKAGEEDAFDADVAKVVADIKGQVDKISETVVAKTEVKLTTLDPDTEKRAVRNAETNLGDLCADAYRDLLGTDVAFVNGGGVRADIAEGDVTYGQIIAVHPFGNMACSIKVTGKQIWDALELGAASYPGESGGFLQVSGIEYTINSCVESPVIKDETGAFTGLKEGAAHRVIDVKIGGKALDEKATYTLGGHNYMLKNGGDGYAMFKGSEVIKDEIAVDNEVLIRFIRDTLKGVVAKDSIYANLRGEGRIKFINEPFTDVVEGDWFYNYVVKMYREGIINGMTETTFVPNGELTRAQVATMLYRMAGEPEVEGESTFADVAKDKWYTNAVIWAEKEGIVNGVGGGKFDPNGKVTREQLVAMMYRMAGSTETECDLSAFADNAKVSSWALAAMKWAVKNEVIGGSTVGGKLVIDPQGATTRAQAAKILCTSFENMPK